MCAEEKGVLSILLKASARILTWCRGGDDSVFSWSSCPDNPCFGDFNAVFIDCNRVFLKKGKEKYSVHIGEKQGLVFNVLRNRKFDNVTKLIHI